MATLEQDARIKRGGSYSLRVDLTDADGDPLNLAGITLHYRVARHESSATPELTVGDADITRDGSTAVIPLTTARTLELEAKAGPGWYHELYMIDSDDERSVLMVGNLTVVHAQAAQHS